MSIFLMMMLLLIPFFSASAETPNCEHWYGGEEGERFQARLDQLTNTQRIDGNDISLYPEAREIFNLRAELIKKAKDHIHVYTLMIEDNETGLAESAQLGNKAFLEGLQVNVIYSPISQIATSSGRVMTALQNLGANVHPYAAEEQFWLHSKIIVGPHKKSLIVDSAEYGLEAIVGGRNIGDNYFANLKNPPHEDFINIWRDTDIHLKGPAINALVTDFIEDFNQHSPDGFQIGCDNKEDCRYYPELKTSAGFIPSTLRVLENEPNASRGKGIFEANTFYQEMIDHAKHSIWIETPYFIPPKPLLDRLHQALDRGVRVRIMTNSKNANDMGAPLFYASIYYWSDLVAAGAEMYQWDVPKADDLARTMHSKVAIADGCVFVPGSWNFDGRAYYWENEYIFPIHNPALVAEAEEMYENDLSITGVTRVDRKWLKKNYTFFEKIKATFYAETLSDLL